VPPDDSPIYAILAATRPNSTLHAHARDWCEQFTEDWRLLTGDGLLDADTDDPKPPNAVGAKTLARRVHADADQLRWADATVYVLVEPDRLDHETGDPFRRSLRVVLERLSADVTFPYDDLDGRERGTWLVECLDAGEVLHPGNNYSGKDGVDAGQRGLDSF
jgi:hypothetical protein